MIEIQITQQQLNTILQALYLLEDQEWYRGQEHTNPLIAQLNELLPE